MAAHRCRCKRSRSNCDVCGRTSWRQDGTDRTLPHAHVGGVGHSKVTALRAGLDPDMGGTGGRDRTSTARGELCSRSGNSRSTACSHRKMARQFDIAEGRAAQSCQPRHQGLRRIVRPPGNGPNPVIRMRSLSLPQHLRDLLGGDRRVDAASQLRPRLFHLGADRSIGAQPRIIRCSSIDHIHLTCCSRRRAANSPDAFIAVR